MVEATEVNHRVEATEVNHRYRTIHESPLRGERQVTKLHPQNDCLRVAASRRAKQSNRVWISS